MIKLPNLYIRLKLSIRTPRGLLKVVQSEKMWRCFSLPIDNFEQVSQITLACLSPTLWIFAWEIFHSIEHGLYKTNIFLISWYITFDLKKYRGVIFHNTEQLCKIWKKKQTCGLENGTRNFANFHQSTWRYQNWNFDEIFLFKVKNAWVKNSLGSYV